jgi:hypothetical protein
MAAQMSSWVRMVVVEESSVEGGFTGAVTATDIVTILFFKVEVLFLLFLWSRTSMDRSLLVDDNDDDDEYDSN